MLELAFPTLLLALGLCLLAAEVFLPTGGVLGLLAAGCLLASFFLANSQSGSWGYRWGVLEAAAIPLTWAVTIYALPRSRWARGVYLRPPTDEDLAQLDDRAIGVAVGKRGRVLTPLRPSGMIDVGGRRVEAIAEFGLIETGSVVTVVAVRSGRAVVRVA